MPRGVTEEIFAGTRRLPGFRRREEILPSFQKTFILERDDVRNFPESPEKQVMIDIDNTLFPLLEGLRDVEPSLKNVSLPANQKALRTELLRAGLNPEELLERVYHDSDVMKRIGAYEGAARILAIIKDHGINVQVVSSRPESSREATEAFLLAANIPYDSLVLGVENKMDYLQQQDITTLVDDNPDLIQRAEGGGRDAISFDWRHAERSLREHGGQEATSWDEIGHHILEAVSTNIGRRKIRESEDPKSIHMQAHDMNMMVEASLAGHEGTCLRRRVGAVILSADGEIIHNGSNQSPPGAPSCEEAGCLIDAAGRCQRTVHAEVNAIMSATPGSLSGSTLYCTDRPCLGCAKTIANSGVRRVVYARPYHAESLEVNALFEASGVEVVEIASAHEDIPLPPSGARDGVPRPDDQEIVEQSS